MTYIIPFHENAAYVNGGANNNTLILYGGLLSTSTKNLDLVYKLIPKVIHGVFLKKLILLLNIIVYQALLIIMEKCIYLVDIVINS